jgi:hypothetical protein
VPVSLPAKWDGVGGETPMAVITVIYEGCSCKHRARLLAPLGTEHASRVPVPVPKMGPCQPQAGQKLESPGAPWWHMCSSLHLTGAKHCPSACSRARLGHPGWPWWLLSVPQRLCLGCVAHTCVGASDAPGGAPHCTLCDPLPALLVTT